MLWTFLSLKWDTGEKKLFATLWSSCIQVCLCSQDVKVVFQKCDSSVKKMQSLMPECLPPENENIFTGRMRTPICYAYYI